MTEIALRDGQLAEIEQDRLRAYDLRVIGYSYPEIARELGMSVMTVWNDVQWCFKNLPREDVISFKGMSIARAEKLIKAAMPSAVAGDDKAARLVLLAQDHIAKLYGAYAPMQVEATVTVAPGLASQLQSVADEVAQEQAQIIDGEILDEGPG